MDKNLRREMENILANLIADTERLPESDEKYNAIIKKKLTEARYSMIKTFILLACNNKSLPLRNFLEQFEKELIDTTLRLTSGHQKWAAEILGMKTSTLNEKMKRLHLNRIDFHQNAMHNRLNRIFATEDGREK